jgi:general stress protein 26
MPPFAEFQTDFLRLTQQIVWCSLTTLDRLDRPRSRIIHPIWEVTDDRPVGWLATRRSPIKVAHLNHSREISLAYWQPSHDAVLLQCQASWADDLAQKQRIWNLFASTPPPLGYAPQSIWSGGPDDPDYSLLRLDAWRVQIVTVQTLTSKRARVWTAPAVPSVASGVGW